METQPRKRYPSDVSEEERAFVAPYQSLRAETGPPRRCLPKVEERGR